MIGITLYARNSSGRQVMTVEVDAEKNELDISIFGTLDGKDIQIDFDSLDAQSAKKFLDFLSWQINKLDTSLS